MNENSLQVWYSIRSSKYISESRRVIGELLAQNPGLTAKEIGLRLYKPINCITPRLLELEKTGAIYRSGKKKHPDSGHQADTWSINPNATLLNLKPNKREVQNVAVE
jgi:hypothetical protein